MADKMLSVTVTETTKQQTRQTPQPSQWCSQSLEVRLGWHRGSRRRNLPVHGLFVPWTIRTLDCSYHGLFVPSLDDSYHAEKDNKPWT